MVPPVTVTGALSTLSVAISLGASGERVVCNQYLVREESTLPLFQQMGSCSKVKTACPKSWLQIKVFNTNSNVVKKYLDFIALNTWESGDI
jgi:hypothetical protein